MAVFALVGDVAVRRGLSVDRLRMYKQESKQPCPGNPETRPVESLRVSCFRWSHGSRLIINLSRFHGSPLIRMKMPIARAYLFFSCSNSRWG